MDTTVGTARRWGVIMGVGPVVALMLMCIMPMSMVLVVLVVLVMLVMLVMLVIIIIIVVLGMPGGNVMPVFVARPSRGGIQ